MSLVFPSVLSTRYYRESTVAVSSSLWAIIPLNILQKFRCNIHAVLNFRKRISGFWNIGARHRYRSRYLWDFAEPCPAPLTVATKELQRKSKWMKH